MRGERQVEIAIGLYVVGLLAMAGGLYLEDGFDVTVGGLAITALLATGVLALSRYDPSTLSLRDDPDGVARYVPLGAVITGAVVLVAGAVILLDGALA